MSTKHDSADKSAARPTELDDDRDTDVEPMTAPAPMTAEKLAAAREPETLDADTDAEPVFAIAHRTAVVQDWTNAREYEAMLVLYATSDGERVCERRYPVDGDEFGAIERSFLAPAESLSTIEENAERFAPVVQRHPEVA